MTPLSCLFLPLRASRTISRQSAEIERLQSENAKLVASRQSLAATLDARQKQINDLDARNEEMRNEINVLRKKLEAAEIDDREYREVLAMTDRFKEQKDSYDQKLNVLRRRLNETRRLLAEKTHMSRNLSEIGFGGDDSDLTDDADWLRQLPD